MELQTVTNIILSVLSFVLAAISVITVVVTLRQNSKMIEESSRPVISIYPQSINPGQPMFYLVVKNFGHSTAYLTEFISSFDFSECYNIDSSKDYIGQLSSCTIAPGQSYICHMDYQKIPDKVHFSVKYKSSTKSYSEEIDVDLKSGVNMPTRKYATPGKEVLSISYSLQELLLKNL